MRETDSMTRRGMAVRGIDDEHVYAGIEQRLGAPDAVLAGAGRGGRAQAPVIVLAGIGELLRLLDVLHRVTSPTQRYASSTTISFSMRCWCRSRFALLAIDGFAHRDELVLGHQLGDRLRGIGGEAHVAIGDDADQLLRAVLDHRNARDAMLRHQASARPPGSHRDGW